MPTITLQIPVSNTVITAGLHASNYNALQTLLNGGLDGSNISQSAALALSNFGITFGADVNLYRSAANLLATDDSLDVNASIFTGGNVVFDGAAGALIHRSQASGNPVIAASVSGDTVDRLTINNQGLMLWGAGGVSAADVNLYRSAADILKTDDRLFSAMGFAADSGASGHPGFAAVRAAGESILTNVLLSSDTQYAFRIAGNGTIEWGVGGSTARDTNLYRSAANVLKTDDTFEAVTLKPIGTPAGGFGITSYVTSESFPRLVIKYGGEIVWGDGTAGGDTNLYRVAANRLKTDDDFIVGEAGTNIRVDGQIEAGTNLWAKADAGKLFFGAAFDTNLYREGANILRTDDAFKAALSVVVDAAGSVGGSEKLYFGSGLDTNLYRSAADTLKTDDTFAVGSNVLIAPDGRITLTERVDPGAVANAGVLYTRDNGGGKTQLCVQFGTGAVQVLATEP